MGNKTRVWLPKKMSPIPKGAPNSAPKTDPCWRSEMSTEPRPGVPKMDPESGPETAHFGVQELACFHVPKCAQKMPKNEPRTQFLVAKNRTFLRAQNWPRKIVPY